MSGPLNSDTIRAGAAGASGGVGYQIDQSIRFNDDDSAFLARTPSASNRKTWTWSAWVKRADLFNGSVPQILLSAGDGGSNDFIMQFGQSDDTLRISDYEGGTASNLITTQLFRDVGAWYHFVLAYDTAQSTAANRIKLYVNGSQVTTFGTETYPSQNNDLVINSNIAHNIGRGAYSSNGYFSGYIAEINFVDGSALSPTSFGETNDEGVWVPLKYTGAYGTAGYHLDGSDSSDLGEDFSGNNNDFSSSGLTAVDQMSDSPTNNHCTLNSIQQDATGLSNGNLQFTTSSTSTHKMASGTIAVTSGKWYCEVTCNATLGSNARIGIIPEDNDNYTGSDGHVGDDAASFAYVDSGVKESNNSQSSYGASYANGDVIAIALNLDDDEVTFYKNGSTQGAISITAGKDYRFAASQYNAGGMAFNFGQAAFAATPPTGFKALNTSNLPATTITDGSAYFHPQLYTGNGSSGLAITNAANAGDFEPDLLIIAPRSNGDNKVWFDDVRGTTKRIKSNSADPGDTDGTAQLTFESNGFDLDTTDGNFNGSSRTYVAWQWKKGATPGFDIVEYTGNKTNRTISHSLGVAPEWIVIKDTSNTESWIVGHNSIGWTKNLFLNLTNGESTSSSIWQDTAPTSSVFSIGTSDGVNKVGSHIAYLWASVDGFSKFGSYTGNGNADGPFVYTGFKPRWVMIKSTGTESWPVLDTARGSGNFGSAAGSNGNNPTAGNDMNAVLVMSTSSAEEDNASGSRRASYLSNGFKVRTTNSAMNSSGQKYVYMAFAEHPFGGDGAAPATAR